MPKKLTTEDIQRWLLTDGRGISLVGPFKNTNTKTTFRCSQGHTWDAIPNNVKSGRGCPTCGLASRSDKQRYTTEDMHQWLLEDGRGFSLVGEYTSARTKTIFRCAHDHTWDATPHNVKQGGSCPTCDCSGGFNPNKPAWEYALDYSDFIKFGITNNLPRRLRDHEKNGVFKLVHQRRHEIGQRARDWENNIKRTYGGRYVTKERCPDGYTETLPISLLEEILRIS